MSTKAIKEFKLTNVTVVKKMRNYSKEPVFKNKAKNAASFIKENGLPTIFKKKVKAMNTLLAKATLLSS